ncbi:MAG: HAD-IIA family hydrolase [Micrococcaceae bacterium]
MSALIKSYDSVFFDLDGVIYEGKTTLPNVVESINWLYEHNYKIGYITNNASRSPETVAEHLQELGIKAKPAEIITSPQVTINLLKEHLKPEDKVLVVGTDYLANLINEAGFRAIRTFQEGPDALIQGFNPKTSWQNLADASYAVHAGAKWFACNADTTLPTEKGSAPGNGAMIKAVQMATGKAPMIGGKPEAAIFEYAMEKFGVKKPIMIGDRLDTDIEGGNNAKIDTALVTTGINTKADAETAIPEQKPTYVIKTLKDLVSETTS